ncbi:MAG: hypothetical protein R3232_08560 [Clostridia bacterium]|nr:hypothetical protein [Clostridia bacterium]
MDKIGLYFDVRDTEYFKRLAEYMIFNYWRYFKVAESREADEGVCIISDYLNRRNRKNVFLIREKGGDISKYSSASAICTALIEKFSSDKAAAGYPGRGETRITCVTSSEGGTGKTTVSKALARLLSEKGLRVSYINPDPFSSEGEGAPGNSVNGYTRFRFHLRKNEGDIPALMEAMAKRNERYRFDQLLNDKPSPDGFMDKGEAALLANSMACGCGYDEIIMDIPPYPSEGHLELMHRADINVLLRGRDEVKHGKFKGFLESSGVECIYEMSGIAVHKPAGDHGNGFLWEYLDLPPELRSMYGEDSEHESCS